MKTLLLTGTINPLVKITHCDPITRRREYVSTIKNYICNTNFEAIVFAENSGFPFSDEANYLSAMAAEHKKKFEYLMLSGGRIGEICLREKLCLCAWR